MGLQIKHLACKRHSEHCHSLPPAFLVQTIVGCACLSLPVKRSWLPSFPVCCQDEMRTLGKYIEKCRYLARLGRWLVCVGIFKQLDVSRPHQSGCLPLPTQAGNWTCPWQSEVGSHNPQESYTLFFFFFATMWGMLNLSSLTRDHTWAPCSGSAEP